MQYDRHLKDPNLKEKYIHSGKRRYEGQNDIGNLKWDTLKEALVTSAIKIISKESRKRNEWMADKIHDMMKKRRKTMPRHGTEYRTLHKEIKNKCR